MVRNALRAIRRCMPCLGRTGSPDYHGDMLMLAHGCDAETLMRLL